MFTNGDVYLLFPDIRDLARQTALPIIQPVSIIKIGFGSSLFDRIGFPQKVKWDFGDPASGIYNSAGIKEPTHLYSAPGNYPVSLMVIAAGDTIHLYDTIHVITPTPYNFGPDIFLCEKGDTSLTAPVIPGAVYQWNDDSLTATPMIHIIKTGVYTVKIMVVPLRIR